MLNSRDVRATGANDITELLDALAPQIGSARGRGGEQAVLLLNGRRISGFRELRDIPTEAISQGGNPSRGSRAQIRLQGRPARREYRLRATFLSTVGRVGGSATTEGGWVSGNADVTQLHLTRSGRTTTNIHAEGNTALTENERDIKLEAPNQPDDRSAQTLYGSKALLRGTETINRKIWATSVRR